MSTEGKVAVITGASRGIGEGLAKAFHDAGIKLGLCARTQSETTSATVVSRAVDVTEYDAVSTFCDQVVETLGPIDLWINNAGILEPIAPMRDISTEEFRRHLDINVVGVFHGSKAYVRHLHRTRHPGVLFNISSGAARKGYSGWSAYCAAKAAVDRLSECISLEETEIDLRVHSIAPGVVDTDMQSLIRKTSSDQFPAVDRFLELKRTDGFSSTQFVARKMLELAFDAAHRSSEVEISFPLGK